MKTLLIIGVLILLLVSLSRGEQKIDNEKDCTTQFSGLYIRAKGSDTCIKSGVVVKSYN